MVSNEATKRIEALPAYERLIPESCEISFKTQTDWKFVEILSFYLGGVGTGLYLISQVLDYTIGLIVGYLLVVVGKNIAHLMASSKPFRAIRVLSQPGTSWISRGAYGIFAFAVLGLFDIVLRIGLVQFDTTVLYTVISVLTTIATFIVMIYVGFVFAEARNIGFWNSPVIPVIIICYSFYAGYSLLLILSRFTRNQFDFSAISIQFLITLGATALIMFSLMTIMKRTTKSAEHATKMLLSGKLSMMFWGGVIVSGLLIPAGITGYYLARSAATSASILSFAGMLALLGAFLFNYCLISAGVYGAIVDPS